MPTNSYDVVVLGAGPAGENAAGRAADHGLRVAIVEADLVGGECSYWACMPSKTLLRPGEVLAEARRVPGVAEAITGPVDVPAVLAYRDTMVAAYDDHGQVPWLEAKGVHLVRGTGRLTGERTVTVTGPDGRERQLEAGRAVVLATGSTPHLPPIPGLAAAQPWTNREATAAKAIPDRLLVVGGGPVGVELAQAFARLGARSVTLIEIGVRLLAEEEPFASTELTEALTADGIDVRLETTVVAVQRERSDGPVTAALHNGTTVTADEILLATGRRPRTDDIGLDAVGLPPGGYLQVDDGLRVAGVPGDWLYAVGDVTGRSLLTHLGKYHGRIVGDVLAGRPARDQASVDAVARIAFTDPQVCAVGLTMERARARYEHVRAVRYPLAHVAGATLHGTGVSGTAALVVDADRHVLLGATFTGPGVAELLHAATIAIVGQVPLERLWHAVPVFPTESEVWLRLLEEYGL